MTRVGGRPDEIVIADVQRPGEGAEGLGVAVNEHTHRQPFPLLSPEVAGSALVELIGADPAELAPAYVLNGAGLHALEAAASPA